VRIDLLPEKYKPQPKVHIANLIILLVALASLLAVGGFALDAFFQNQALGQELPSDTQILNGLQIQLNEARQKEALFAQVEQFHKEIATVQGRYQAIATVLRNIAGAIPKDVWLDEAGISPKGQVKLTGGSILFPLLGDFLTNITNLDYFQPPKLQDISQRKINSLKYYQFTLVTETGRSSLEYAETKGR
jgi:Tfp pilus assembly protein PilN